MTTINCVNEIRSEVGEGPNWDAGTSTISWVDIAGKLWFEQNINGGPVASHSVPEFIGAIVGRKKGGYYAATKEGFAELNPDNGWKVTKDFLKADERMNDAKVDSAGRFWAGSCTMDMVPGTGALHVLSGDLTMKTVATGITLPNGLAWSADNSFFYHVDSMQHVLTSYEVDFENAELHNKKTLVSFPDDGSVPDGMCVSDEGLLLVAMWGGSRIEIYDQKGKKQSVIDMPVKQPSSCTFGGAKGDRLIVTSARASLGDTANELDGGLFIVDGLGLTGAQSEKFNG